MAAFVVASLLAYLLPSAIAYWRSARQTAAIAATNLLLGWTILGWIGALAWALANRRADE